MKIDGQGSF